MRTRALRQYLSSGPRIIFHGIAPKITGYTESLRTFQAISKEVVTSLNFLCQESGSTLRSVIA